nr:MAG: capsid protein [Lake Sinai virus 2]
MNPPTTTTTTTRTIRAPKVQLAPNSATRRRRNRRRRRPAATVAGPLSIQPSSINRRMVSRVTRRSAVITAAGLAWLRQYLNPMGPDTTSVTGYPDGSAVTTCIADYSNTFNVSFPPREALYCTGSSSSEKPTLVDADNYAKIDKWSTYDITLCVLALPMLRNVVMLRLYPHTPTAFALTEQTPNFPQRFPNWSVYSADGTRFNNGDEPGYLQSYVYLPNVDKHLSAARGYRLLSRGITGIFSAPALETQGFVTACQYLAEGSIQSQSIKSDAVRSVTVNSDGTVKNVESSSQTVSSMPRYVFPLDGDNCAPSSLTETYHQAYQSKATDGFYMPVLSSSRDNPFHPPQPRAIAVYGSFLARGCLDPVSEAHEADGPTHDIYRLNVADDVAPLFNTGVVWFEGISPKFSLKLKTRTVLQYIPTSGSVLANFTRHEPTYDQIALDAADRLRNLMPHAYPAAYNDWGWLGDLLDSAISMLPGVGTVYNIAKPLIKPAWNWLGNKVSDFFGNPVARDGDIFFDAK